MSDLKRKKPFQLNLPKTGDFGGGTQAARYFDKEGKEVPYDQTKWCKLSKKGGKK